MYDRICNCDSQETLAYHVFLEASLVLFYFEKMLLIVRKVAVPLNSSARPLSDGLLGYFFNLK